RSQRYDSIAPCTEERIGADEQCISMLLDERPKRRFQLPIVSRHGDFDPPIDGACRILNLSRLGFGSLIVWIDQHTNKGCIGHEFVQQPEPLCLRYRGQEADPRGIATGAVKTGDQTNLDWIATNGEHNRNRRRRSLGSKRRRFASCRGEDRHPTPNEISRQRWKAIILALGPGVRPWSWTGSRGGFDPLPGVVILELRGAQVAERGVQPASVVDLVNEAGKIRGDVLE